MVDIQIVETEEVLKSGHLIFSVRFHVEDRDIEFRVAVQDQGSLPLNEAAVLRSSLSMTKALETSIQLRLATDGLFWDPKENLKAARIDEA